MSDDPQGNYTAPNGTTAVDGQTALASQHNLFVQDASAALSRRLFADGRKAWTGNQNANGRRVTGAGDAVDQQDYVTLSQMQDAIAAVSGFFPGIMVPETVGYSDAPEGWLYANGQTVPRADHPNLWASVQAGTNLAASEGAKTHGQYGPGDGSTTFTLPNLYADNGYFIRPISDGRGIGTVQADAIKTHSISGTTDEAGGHRVDLPATTSHGPSTQGFITSTGRDLGTARSDTVPDHEHDVTLTYTGAPETRVKNIAYPVLIKT